MGQGLRAEASLAGTCCHLLWFTLLVTVCTRSAAAAAVVVSCMASVTLPVSLACQVHEDSTSCLSVSVSVSRVSRLQIVKRELTLEEKKKFLKFFTGSDR